MKTKKPQRCHLFIKTKKLPLDSRLTTQAFGIAIRTALLLSSTCAILVCSNSFASTILADSVADYSIVQGQKNWFYGYCVGSYSMNAFSNFTTTFNCCGLGDSWATDQNVWTALWQWGGHPNGLDGNGGKNQVLQLAVRRWVSTYQGPVTIQGVTSSCDAPGIACNGGDTTAEIYVNGVKVFSSPVTSSAQVSYSISTNVSIGNFIDFVIRTTGISEVNGGTTFTAQVVQPDVQYQAFDGSTYYLRPWLGTNVALLTPTNSLLSNNVMAQIHSALDKAYAFYGLATGHQPTPYAPTTYLGRDTIAVVSSTCGAGCSYIGFTGTEILLPYFNILYNGVASSNVYDQVLFYEFGRNFWFYSDQLAYHTPDTDPVVTGFAVYMRFLSMEAAGVAGGPFNGYSFTTFATTVTNLMDYYITNSSLNWSNTFRISQAPANPLGLGGTDLIASLLMRIGRDFGGPSFALNFWKQAELRSTAATTQAAVDNFILTACATVNKNLTTIFSTTWKFPVSATAVQEAQSRWGNPVALLPILTIRPVAGRNVIIQWQSQVNTVYQLQVSSNLQTWTDSELPTSGDGAIHTLTNSTSAFTNSYFRLKLQ